MADEPSLSPQRSRYSDAARRLLATLVFLLGIALFQSDVVDPDAPTVPSWWRERIAYLDIIFKAVVFALIASAAYYAAFDLLQSRIDRTTMHAVAYTTFWVAFVLAGRSVLRSILPTLWSAGPRPYLTPTHRSDNTMRIYKNLTLAVVRMVVLPLLLFVRSRALIWALAIALCALTQLAGHVGRRFLAICARSTDARRAQCLRDQKWEVAQRIGAIAGEYELTVPCHVKQATNVVAITWQQLSLLSRQVKSIERHAAAHGRDWAMGPTIAFRDKQMKARVCMPPHGGEPFELEIVSLSQELLARDEARLYSLTGRCDDGLEVNVLDAFAAWRPELR